jgi:hypothetical protein
VWHLEWYVIRRLISHLGKTLHCWNKNEYGNCALRVIAHVGPGGFPQISLRNYHYTLCNSPEEHSSEYTLWGSDILHSWVWMCEKLFKTIIYSVWNVRKKGRQCTCNITMWRDRVNIVTVHKQQVLRVLSVCLWLQSYRMQNACAILYCHMWPVWLYHILPHFRHKRYDFRKKKFIEHKMLVLSFCINFVWKSFHSKKKLARYCHRCA